MARTTINVPVLSAQEGASLVHALDVRGMDARLAYGNGGVEVEVRGRRRQDMEPVLYAVLSALRDWLDGREQRAMTVRVDSRRYRFSGGSSLAA